MNYAFLDSYQGERRGLTEDNPHMLLWEMNATHTPPVDEELRREFNSFIISGAGADAAGADAAGADAGADAAGADAGADAGAEGPAEPTQVVLAQQALAQGMEFLRAQLRNYVDTRTRVERLEQAAEVVRSRCTAMRRDSEELIQLVYQGVAIAAEGGGGGGGGGTMDEDVDICVSNLMAYVSVMEDVLLGTITKALQDTRRVYGDTCRHLRSLVDVYQNIRCTSASYTCPVCLTDSVSVYVSPCGHTFCSRCAPPRHGVQKCFLCRVNVASVHHLFFSG